MAYADHLRKIFPYRIHVAEELAIELVALLITSDSFVPNGGSFAITSDTPWRAPSGTVEYGRDRWLWLSKASRERIRHLIEDDSQFEILMEPYGHLRDL